MEQVLARASPPLVWWHSALNIQGSWAWNSCLEQVLCRKHIENWAQVCLDCTPQHQEDLQNCTPWILTLAAEKSLFLMLEPTHPTFIYLTPVSAGACLQLPTQQPSNPVGIWHLQMQYWCLPVSLSTSGVENRITADCLSLAKTWEAPHQLHSLSLVSASKSMVFGRLYLYRACYSTAVRELHPKREYELRLASSLHISYLLPLALCSEQAGLSPSQYEQPCSPTEFHQNPGHLHSGKVKQHRETCLWTYSASVLALTQPACITPTAQLDHSPLEPHNASEVSRLRRAHAGGPQHTAVQLCSAWYCLVSSRRNLQTRVSGWLTPTATEHQRIFSKGRQHWWWQLCLLKCLEKAGTNFGQKPRENLFNELQLAICLICGWKHILNRE